MYLSLLYGGGTSNTATYTDTVLGNNKQYQIQYQCRRNMSGGTLQAYYDTTVQ